MPTQPTAIPPTQPMNDVQSQAHKVRWRTGLCTVDLERQMLLRGGVPVRLRPKAWALLTALLQRPNAVIRSAELLDALWPRQSIHPKALVNVISELRIALGDSGALRSVHRRGYVLTATSEKGADAMPRTPSASVVDTCDTSAAFVGREPQQRALHECMARALKKQLQIVEVVGPAGVGKSTLVERWAADVVAEGNCTVLRGRAVELAGEREPFGPLLQMLEGYTRTADSKAIKDDLRRLAPCWLAQLPGLLSDAELGQLRQELYRTGTGRMLREAVSLIEHWSAQMPVLMLLEDTHWADTATLDLLGMLSQSTSALRLMLVMTRRQQPGSAATVSPVPGLHRALSTDRGKVLTLAGLEADAIEAYLGIRCPAVTDAHVLGRQLAEITGGLPLFLKLVVDGLLAVVPPPHGKLAAEMKHRAVPGQLRHHVLDRAASLTVESRAVLDVACCMVVPVPLPILAYVLDLPEAEVQAQCAQLVKLGLLQAGPKLLPWRDGRLVRSYGFAHALYRDVFHGELGHDLLMALNRRMASALQDPSSQQQAASAAQLAIVYEQADMHAEAAAALRLSCMRSLGRFATRHAVSALQDALRHLEQLPDSHETRILRLETCWDLARLLLLERSPTCFEVEAMRDRILRLAPQVDTARARFLLHGTRYMRAIYSARADLARGPLQDFMQAGQHLGEHERALTHVCRGGLAMAECHLAECRAAFEACLSLPLAGSGMAGNDVHALAASQLVWTLAMTGEFDAFIERAASLEAEVRAGRSRYLLKTVLLWVGEAMRLLDCSPAAARYYGELLSLCDEHDRVTFGLEAGLGLQACLDPAQRDVQVLQGLATRHHHRGPAWSDHVLSTLLLPALISQARLAEAMAVLADLAKVEQQWPFYQSERLRLEGDLEQAQGREAAAQGLWHRALALDSANGFVPGLLRCLERQPAPPGGSSDPLVAQARAKALATLSLARLDHPDLNPLRVRRDSLRAAAALDSQPTPTHQLT